MTRKPDRITVRVKPFSDREFLQLRWTDPQTGRRKTRSAGTTDANLAEQRRADLEYELNNGLFNEPSRISWQAFRETFEREYLSGKRRSTRLNYRITFGLLEELASPAKLSAVNARLLSGFVASMRALPTPRRGGITSLKASTIALHLEHLKAVLRWAVEQGFLAKCPDFPVVSVPKKRPQPVPAEAVERLLSGCKDDQLRAYMLCGWLAGLRRNEAYHLEWEETEAAPWVNLAADRVVFPAEFVKADEDQWVPLDPDLKAALQALPKREGDARVFRFAKKNGDPVRPDHVVRRMTQLAKRVGVRLTMRTLRRGFGCRYAARVPAQVLQRLMRHSDIAITLTYYASMDDAVEEAVLGPRESRNTRCNTVKPASQPPETVPDAIDCCGYTCDDE